MSCCGRPVVGTERSTESPQLTALPITLFIVCIFVVAVVLIAAFVIARRCRNKDKQVRYDLFTADYRDGSM